MGTHATRTCQLYQKLPEREGIVDLIMDGGHYTQFRPSVQLLPHMTLYQELPEQEGIKKKLLW